MSDLGLNANIYEVTKKYLDLVNDFLLGIRNEEGDTETRDKLISFLKKLDEEDNIEPHIQMVSVILDRHFDKRRKKFTNLLDQTLSELENTEVNNKLEKDLEKIANALNEECVEALSRM